MTVEDIKKMREEEIDDYNHELSLSRSSGYSSLCTHVVTVLETLLKKIEESKFNLHSNCKHPYEANDAGCIQCNDCQQPEEILTLDKWHYKAYNNSELIRDLFDKLEELTRAVNKLRSKQ